MAFAVRDLITRERYCIFLSAVWWQKKVHAHHNANG